MFKERFIRRVQKFAAAVALIAAPTLIGLSIPQVAHANMPTTGSVVCGGTAGKALLARRPDNFRGRAFVVAMAQCGDYYLYGAAGPDRFDCSGLQYYSFRRVGNQIPRTSYQQRYYTRTVAYWSNMRAGDLLFYSGHVEMYAGAYNGVRYAVSANTSGSPVKLHPVRYSGLIKKGRVPYRPL